MDICQVIKTYLKMQDNNFDPFLEDYKPLQEGDICDFNGVGYIVISSKGKEVILKKMCNVFYVYDNLK